MKKPMHSPKTTSNNQDGVPAGSWIFREKQENNNNNSNNMKAQGSKELEDSLLEASVSDKKSRHLDALCSGPCENK